MMNLTRYSKTATALLCIAVLLSAVGTAAALSISSEGVPSEAQVGEEVSVTYTIDDPFTDTANQWTLQANTELESVSWTVTVLRAGSPVENGETTYGEQSFQQDLNVDNNGDEVQIELVGTVPEVDQYSYQPPQSFVVTSLEQQTGSNTDELQNDTAHYYTSESQSARQAIDEAQAAIDESGGNEEAQSTLDDAIAFYNSGENFQQAQDAADRARNAAQSAQQSQQTTQTILYAAGGLVVLLLLGGGIYYWQSQQGDEFSKL